MKKSNSHSYIFNPFLTKKKLADETVIDSDNPDSEENIFLYQSLEDVVLDKDFRSFKEDLSEISRSFFQNYKSKYTIKRKRIRNSIWLASACAVAILFVINFYKTDISIGKEFSYKYSYKTPTFKSKVTIDNRSLLPLAIDYHYKKKYDEAIFLLQKIVEKNNVDENTLFSAFYYLGDSLLKQENTLEALSIFKDLKQKASKDFTPDIQWNIILCNLQLGKLEQTKLLAKETGTNFNELKSISKLLSLDIEGI